MPLVHGWGGCLIGAKAMGVASLLPWRACWLRRLLLASLRLPLLCIACIIMLRLPCPSQRRLLSGPPAAACWPLCTGKAWRSGAASPLSACSAWGESEVQSLLLQISRACGMYL